MSRPAWLIAAAFFASTASAGSSFPSTVRGITIGNTHVVLRGNGIVLRGSAPNRKAQELVRTGVTDVLVFKNATGGEVAAEIAELRAAGIPANRIYQIPFPWKSFPSFRSGCEQIVRALAILDNAYRSRGRSAFFHCTVGEDRTGVLAGLFLLLEKGGNPAAVFQSEFCAKGYEKGDRGKPLAVVSTIRRALTPMFLKMANLIGSGALTRATLTAAACRRDPGVTAAALSSYVCR